MNLKRIKYNIARAIKEGKWLRFDYINTNDENTFFWCGIKDIYKENISGEIYNPLKSTTSILNARINFNNIRAARVIEFSKYDTPELLITKLENDESDISWLEYNNFKYNVLLYLAQCNELGTEPFQSNYALIPEVDCHVLRENKDLKLNDNQILYLNTTIDKEAKKKDSYKNMIINLLSISVDEKLYVVAYQNVHFNPKSSKLELDNEIRINKTFLIEGKRHSLSTYLDMDADEFNKQFISDREGCTQILKNSLKSGETIDERPYFMILARDYTIDLFTMAEELSEQKNNKELKAPLKAFFGDASTRNDGIKEPDIILMDDKVNIDQVRVVYNTMKNAITYVQGPPGTGKTTTILNVILSAFFSNKKCLLVSNNNKPIDGIISKIRYEYKNQKIPFPLLRIGDERVNLKACDKIKTLYEVELNIVIKEEQIERIKDNTKKNYGKLSELLKKYEERVELIRRISEAEKFLSKIPFDVDSKEINRFKKAVADLKTQLNNCPVVKNEDVLKYAISAKSDYYYMQYLYFESFKHLLKLKQNSYKELIEIVYIKDESEKVKKFNKYIGNEENLKKLLQVFPFIATTNHSASKLGNNRPYFDICIMDEAGQCNVALALVPICRASRLLLVGDQNQLQPVISLDSNINRELMKKYLISEDYNFCEKSILKLMLDKDKVSKSIFLSYHYRCGRRIITFSNKRYYDNKLKIMENKKDVLGFIDVKNSNKGEERNSYYDEAMGIVNYIKKNNVSDCAVITPFRNQAFLINDLLLKNGINKADVCAGTIHTLQGDEKDTIILSTAISLRSSKKTYAWIANNKELLNVAVTRAKNKLIVAGDYEALKVHSKANDDIIELCNYVKENGKCDVMPSNYGNIEIGKSNASKNETEFFITVSHFCSVNKEYKIERNISVNQVIDRSKIREFKKYFNKAEFDLVFYQADKVKIVIEVNGGEHFDSENDIKKKNLCNEMGIKFLMISNDFVKSYEYIRTLLLSMVGVKEQLSLFDE